MKFYKFFNTNMEFFLVFKAFVLIYFISFPCGHVNGAISYTEYAVSANNEGKTVTIFVGNERNVIFNSRQKVPADLTKAACFQLDEKAANSLRLDPMQFISFEADNREYLIDSGFSHHSTKIFTCLTDSLFVFVYVKRVYKYYTAEHTGVKSILYNSDVLNVKSKSCRLSPCLGITPKIIVVTEKSYREHGDINKILKMSGSVKIDFYDPSKMKDFWPST